MFNDRNNSMLHYKNSVGVTTLSNFIMKVYFWMMAGLLITGVTAYGVFSSKSIFITLFSSKLLVYCLFALQLAVVFFLPNLARKNPKLAVAGFFLYAFVLGITLSSIFAIFEFSSIVNIFGIASGMFGVMALYGYFTKADLTGFGSIMYMGLFGIVIASLVNLFLQSQQMHYILSYLGVIIFTGLTAYDMQKIKELGQELIETNQSVAGAAILGALTLYLDFINIFLHLLSLLGKRK